MNILPPWQGRHRAPALRRLVLRYLVLTAAILVLGGMAHGWIQRATEPDPVPTSRPAGGGASQTGDAVPPDTTVPDQPTRRPAAPVPTTPEAMLELLTQLLPSVRVGSVAGYSDDADILVDADIVRGRAQNRLRVVLRPDVPADQRPARPCGPSNDGVRCSVLPNGAILRLDEGDTCRQRYVSEMERRDGTRVRVELAACGRADNGEPTRATAALTPDEFQLIAVDDQWARRMRPELRDAGRRHFPDLPAVRDPDEPPRRRL